MTNAELIAKIKAEIERLIVKHELEYTTAGYVMNELLSFLSTLESEKPMNQKGLEREIERCLWKLSDDPSNEELRMFARNFYDLGCRHTAEKYDEIEYNRQRAEESVCKDLEKEIDFQTFSKEMGAVFALPKERTKNTEEEPLRWEYEIARHFAKWGAEHLDTSGKTISVKSGDEITINGHKIIYDKDKGYVTIVKSEESVPNDLEEAAKKYATEWHENPDGSAWKPYFEVSAIKAFIAGAKWQKQHDAELIEIAYNDGITIGMTKQKEQVDAIITSRLSEIIGDAQPKPALRAELQELINKIDNNAQ